jgi:FMN phosphatase YigB (HAD superfamily)
MNDGGALEVRLGKRVQDFRKKAGFTQQELCHKAKLSYSTLAKIERGAIKSPSVFTMQSIAQSIGSSLDDLVGGATSGKSKEFKTSKSGVKFIYFNVNDTLVRYHQRAFSNLAKDLGMQPDLVETAFWFYSEELDKGQLSLDEFNKLFAGRLGVPSVDWKKYYIKAAESVPGVSNLLDKISKEYKFGILANMFPGGLNALMESNKIPELNYDGIVDSSLEGATKPDQKMFKVAQKKAGLEANEILLIDESMSNLVAAQKAGWHTLWFDSSAPEDSITNVLKFLE